MRIAELKHHDGIFLKHWESYKTYIKENLKELGYNGSITEADDSRSIAFFYFTLKFQIKYQMAVIKNKENIRAEIYGIITYYHFDDILCEWKSIEKVAMDSLGNILIWEDGKFVNSQHNTRTPSLINHHLDILDVFVTGHLKIINFAPSDIQPKS